MQHNIIVLETSTNYYYINQPPLLHQYNIVYYGYNIIATPSATFHAKFLDQRLKSYSVRLQYKAYLNRSWDQACFDNKVLFTSMFEIIVFPKIK